MKKLYITVFFLVIALIISNAWWAYRLIDSGVSYTYLGESLDDNQKALAQTLEIIKVLTEPNASRDSIIEAAQQARSSIEPFEKEGYLWVGQLGLRFNNANQLIEVVTSF